MWAAASVAAVAVIAVATDAIDVADGSRCVDAVAAPAVRCCCQVFDANDNDNDFVDFRVCKMAINQENVEKKSIKFADEKSIMRVCVCEEQRLTVSYR